VGPLHWVLDCVCGGGCAGAGGADMDRGGFGTVTRAEGPSHEDFQKNGDDEKLDDQAAGSPGYLDSGVNLIR